MWDKIWGNDLPDEDPWVFEAPKSVVQDKTEQALEQQLMNVLSVDQLSSSYPTGNIVTSDYDGEKYIGGFGITQDYAVDYATLRARSSQLFTENLYARGLIRRLITNTINTGLCLEAIPVESVIGVSEGSLDEWSDDTEARNNLWADDPELCDYYGRLTFGKIQRAAKAEALISGDVLVVIHIDPVTFLPKIQLIRGDRIESPLLYEALKTGHRIEHGVELDARGRHVAFWVYNPDTENHERIEATGSKSGRRVAWLLYGTDARLDEVRGQPLLSLVLQSIKEVDRYRDSTQRKATLNSILAMFIEKTQKNAGSRAISNGAVRRDSASVTDGDGASRTFNMAKMVPGMYMEELAYGEKPQPYSTQGTDVNFPAFEAAIIHAIAWANEIPPEILQLAFSNNYSASQAAINEFKMFLNKDRSDFSDGFLDFIYEAWLFSQVRTSKIKAPGLIASLNDPKQYDIKGAWLASDWTGAIKPSTDIAKQAKGSEILVKNCWSTNSKTSRELTGTKFGTNVRRVAQENRKKAEAMRPLLELEREFGTQEVATAAAALNDATFALADVVSEISETG